MSRNCLACAVVLSLLFNHVFASDQNPVNEPGWWMTPHRMVQTNLREIDATMDIDQYVREIKEFGANTVLFNVGGIVANYPSQLEYHWKNTFMEGDLVGTALKKLHAADIKMIGRFDFSKLNEKYAMKHPEWLYVIEKGENVNYNGQVHTCIMGGYQQEYIFKILEEALTKYPLDGVFFNMIGFPQTDYSRVYHGICQCDNCRRSFKEYCGRDLPKHDGDPDIVNKYKAWQQVQISRQFGRVRDLIKSIRQDIAICTYTVNHIDVIRKESGQPLGVETWDDLERAQWTLLTTDDKQLANATVHFYQMIFRHSAAAPYLHSRRLWQQMINGAWLDFYCIGPLQRLEDRAALGPISDVFRFHAANEKWLINAKSAADVGIVRHDGDDYWGWVQMMSENHVPFDLVSFDRSSLDNYKVLIVPDSERVSSGNAGKLDAFVKAGGKLVLSGKMPAGLKCLNSPKLLKTWPPRHSMYLRITADDKKALAVDGLKDYDIVQLRGVFYEYEKHAGTDNNLLLIHDVMYGPPEKCYYKSVSDIPGLLSNEYGKGTAALFPFQIGAMYREWGNLAHPMLAMGVIDSVLDADRRVKVETTPLVEVTHRADPDGKFEWVSLYNHSGRLENSFHKPIPISNIKISLKTKGKVKRIVSLTNGAEIMPIKKTDSEVEIQLDKLDVFEVVVFEYE